MYFYLNFKMNLFYGVKIFVIFKIIISFRSAKDFPMRKERNGWCFKNGSDIEQLASKYSLAESTVRNIKIYIGWYYKKFITHN